MRVFNPTIMHTGTHFCRRILFKGWAKVAAGSPCEHENVLTNVHVMECEMKRIHAELERTDLTIVVPLRHPARVFYSFMNRGKSKEMFVEQWDNMINIIAPHNPYYIHLDLPERRNEVDLIEEAIGMKLPVSDDDAEWEVINSKARTHDMLLTEFPIDEVPQQYIDFYESTRKYKPI